MNNYSNELNLVAKTLTYAEKYNLECEVILAAFKYMQDHPGCTVNQALDAGLELINQLSEADFWDGDNSASE